MAASKYKLLIKFKNYDEDLIGNQVCHGNSMTKFIEDVKAKAATYNIENDEVIEDTFQKFFDTGVMLEKVTIHKNNGAIFSIHKMP